jgi:hypothetical protein
MLKIKKSPSKTSFDRRGKG